MIPKFRAWDKIDKKMIDVGSIRFNGEKYSELADITGYNPFYEDIWISPKEKRNVLPIHEIELMQSVGLKDKDGVDIYEGDIVEYFHTPAVIERVKGGFAIVNTKGYEYTTDLNGHMRILGNIYENPELMEVVE